MASNNDAGTLVVTKFELCDVIGQIMSHQVAHYQTAGAAEGKIFLEFPTIQLTIDPSTRSYP
jgi:hypothetical protein